MNPAPIPNLMPSPEAMQKMCDRLVENAEKARISFASYCKHYTVCIMEKVEDVSIEAQAARLKKARKQRYASVIKAAEGLGINSNTLRAHETGRNGFQIGSAKFYAKSYGVSLQWLLTGEGDELASDWQEQQAQVPSLAVTATGKGNARLQVDMTVPMATALKVATILGGGE